MSDQLSIRRGDPTDRLAVVRLFDAAMLDTEFDRLSQQLTGTDGAVLIATRGETPVGAIALDYSSASDEKRVAVDATRIRCGSQRSPSGGDDATAGSAGRSSKRLPTALHRGR